jgi:transposase
MPRPKEHVVALTLTDRGKLRRIVSSGTHPARMITRARILLALDETDPPVADRAEVAHRLGTSEGTVFLVAKQFAQCGGRVDEVITRKKRVTPPIEPKVTGEVEARIMALACTKAPEGRDRWTLRLLEQHVLLTEGIPPVDHSTIGRVLKRGGLSLI